MRKSLAILSFLMMLFFIISGCSMPTNQLIESEYIELQTDYDKLLEEYTSLSKQYDDLVAEYSEYKSEMSIPTTKPDNNQDKSESKNSDEVEIEVFSDDYVTIWYNLCEKDKFYSLNNECNVVFTVENKTGVELTIRIDSIAVDGWNLSDAFVFQEIAPSSKGYVSIASEELRTLTPQNLIGVFTIADKSYTLWGALEYTVPFDQMIMN